MGDSIDCFMLVLVGKFESFVVFIHDIYTQGYQ